MRALIGLLILTGTALAQEPMQVGPGPAIPTLCGPYDQMEAMLYEKYKEVPVRQGIAGTATFMVFVSPSGSFTTLLRLPGEKGDTGCMGIVGEDWKGVAKSGETL